LVFEKQLASGAFGEVWRGVLRGVYEVAIKKIFETSSELDILKDPEIKILQRVRHPRLVMFLGCGRMQTGEVFLVLEFCDSKDLTSLLKPGRGAPDWKLRLSLLCDIAEVRFVALTLTLLRCWSFALFFSYIRTYIHILHTHTHTQGMVYLHCVVNTIHRDLKTDNVLLQSEKGNSSSKRLRAKIADFGLSKFENEVQLPSKLNTDDKKVADGVSTLSMGDIELPTMSLNVSNRSDASNKSGSRTMTAGMS